MNKKQTKEDFPEEIVENTISVFKFVVGMLIIAFAINLIVGAIMSM